MADMAVFDVTEHVLESQHIREYPQATAGTDDEPLVLHIKQYTPRDNPHPQPGDVTIIGAHANGFPKELYEPLWESIIEHAKTQGFRIRGIWIADVAQQGWSSVLNEELLGNAPCWNDHPRDLLHMVNHFRASMPRPIVGVGHSMGGNHLIKLALLHPRLLTSIVCIDPIISDQSTSNPAHGALLAQSSTFRRDLWPSREEAAASFKRSKFYQRWDPRVLERWLQYGLRDVPTHLYPDAPKGAVTLTTTKHQEAFSFLKPYFAELDGVAQRKEHPDLNPHNYSLALFPFYRPEIYNNFQRLEEVRPTVLYVFPGASNIAAESERMLKLKHTGAGVGGSGGVALGRVKEVVIDGASHLAPMEAVDDCAAPTAEWFGRQLREWREDEIKYREWAQKPLLEKTTLSPEWRERIGLKIKVGVKL